MKKLLQNLKYVKLYDILSVFIFLILFIPALIYRAYLKISHKRLWLITEEGYFARDNAYHFYKYVRTQHRDICAYYVIDKKSNDYKKVKQFGNIIQFRGFKHWIYYLSSEYNISSQKNGNPAQALFYVLHVKLGILNNRVFLQHGVIKDKCDWLFYNETKFEYFVCGAKREYEYIKQEYGYDKKSLLLTGLPRFDGLDNVGLVNNQILIMPTWRNWLGRETNSLSKNEDFTETEYFKNWNGLLNDPEFINFVENHNLTVKFYPHINMQRFLNNFSSTSSNIEIVSTDYDIQKALNESAIMITDFSSVFMDFGYLQKPIVYFQFDENEYREKQYQQGYFDYRKDGFGPVINSLKKLVQQLNLMYKGGQFSTKKEYLNRMKNFFIRDGKSGSEKIYEELKSNVKHETRLKQDRKIIENVLVYLSIAAVFLSAFTLYIYYTITPVMIVGLLIAFYRIRFKVKQNTKVLLFEILYLLFYLFAILSLLWTYDFNQSIKISFKVAAIIISVLQYRALYSSVSKEKILKAFRALTTIFILATFVLYISCLFSLNFNFNRANMDLVGLIIDRKMPRLVTTANSDPNISCIFLILPIIYYVCSYNDKMSRKKKILNIVNIVAYTIATILTLSRGGIIALATIYIGYLLFGKQNIKTRLKIFAVPIVTVLIIVLPTMMFLSGTSAQNHNKSFFETITSRFSSMTSDGGSGRIRIWNNAIKTFNEHQIAGIGIGSTRSYSIKNYKEDHYVHNTFLEVLSEMGIIGFCLFVTALIVAIICSIKARSKDNALSLLICISLFVNTFFISMQYNEVFYVHLLIVWLCVSGALSNNRMIANEC